MYFYRKVLGNILHISKKDIIIVHMFYLLRWTSKKLWDMIIMNELTENSGNVINWSEKVKNLDENIRREIGIEGENKAKHILIKVQTKSAESIEPAFIVSEDDTFLDLFVLSPQGAGITSTAVLKSNIQSVGVIGGVSAEKIDSTEIPEDTDYDDLGGLYQ